MSDAATATFSNDNFSNNVAEDGGGIAFFGTQLTLSNSHVDGNRTEGSEGGLDFFTSNSGASCTVTDTTIDGNHAADEEGGAFIECITVTITNSSIDGNRSGSSVGGLETEGTTITFTNVNVIGNFAGSSEGGLETDEMTLTMTGCTISNNQAGSSDGGFFAEGTATITNTTISGNRSGDSVGGLDFDGAQLKLESDTITNNSAASSDGGVFDESTNGGTISNTTISGNSTAGDAGGIEAENFGGTLSITGSTISNNHAGADGGGLFIDSTSTVTLANDTLFGNTASADGGAIADESSAGALNLQNVTIDGNAAATGGGVFKPNAMQLGQNVVALAITQALTINVHNTIIAGNSANANNGPDVSGVFVSQGFNFIGVQDVASSSFTNGANNDQVGSAATPKNPLLGPLTNNGGPTLTQALLPGSPAIARGDNSGAPTKDQRGFNRPVTPSIGAYEPQVAANAGAKQVFVENLYEELLDRSADSGSVGFVNELNGGVSPATLVLQIEGSLEYRADQVKLLYQRYLHRDADGGSLQNFANLLGNGATLEQVSAILLGSQEYFDLHGGSNESFLNAVFEDALNRGPDQGALLTFGQALAGGMSRSQAALLVLSSTEYQNDLVQADFQSALGRQTEAVGLAGFVGELQRGGNDQLILAQILGSDEAFAKRT
jgi:hypothetical protein